MEANERIRTVHRPDWIPIVLGTTCVFAIMGVTSMIGVPAGLMRFTSEESVAAIVTKILLNMVAIVFAFYVGGYVCGLTTGYRSRVASAMNVFLIWQLTALAFAVTGWFGVAPLPGIYFTHGDATQAGPGILWMALSFLFPLAIPAAYGAMAANDHVHAELLPEEREARLEYAETLDLAIAREKKRRDHAA